MIYNITQFGKSGIYTILTILACSPMGVHLIWSVVTKSIIIIIIMYYTAYTFVTVV